MSFIKTNMVNFEREFKADGEFAQKASKDAAKIESFRLMRLMRKEIRQGAPGGNKFKDMRVISKATQSRMWGPTYGAKKGILSAIDKPLYMLSKVAEYRVADKGLPFHTEIGFLGYRFSNTWKNIAMKQQTGQTIPVPGGYKKMLRYAGGTLKRLEKKYDSKYVTTANIEAESKGRGFSRMADWKYFFLRKGTTSFVIPSRDIVDSFRAAHLAEIAPNIRRNFEEKMAQRWINQGKIRNPNG